ncbi:MAG: tetratricopeptide repeat protein [Planctomycetota bacterium]|jgi:tetratricopeptide (TPR) repeat protein
MLIHLTLLASCAPAAPALHVTTPALPSVAPAADDVADLIRRGKAELLAGKADQALASFREAHDKNGGAVDTEVWVLRARMATGELDPAFERVVELEAEGKGGMDVQYLIGVARYEFGRRLEAQGSPQAGGAYQEAAAYLKDVMAADGDRYPDAWFRLAAASRWMGELEGASAAIDRALEASRDAECLALAAKIRVARGAALMGDEATRAAGTRAIEQGVRDAREAAKALGSEKEMARQQADVHLQLGVGLLFLEKKGEAADAYATAMGWDPTQVDYGQLLGSMTDAEGTVAPFVAALEKGAAAFEKRWGKRISSDAGLLWWLGYGQFTLGRYEPAIASFESSVAKFPAYSNAHWYVALSQYFRGKEHDVEAGQAFRRFADASAASFAQMVNSSPQNKAYPGRLLFRLWDSQKFEAAADLAEVRLLADETDPLLWNDVGLMNRDAGDHVRRAEVKEPKKTPMEYYERALVAYEKALELDRKPQYLNDGAVILHYGLQREPERAIAMYDEAEKLALEMQAKGEFAEGEEEIVKIALRDARNNRKLLKRALERQKEKQQEKKGDGGDAGGR